MVNLLQQIKNKFYKMPDSAKSAIAFTLTSLFLKAISFFTTPIFTRLMDTSQYGLIATFVSWQSILEVFAFVGLTSAGVFNVGLNDYRDNRNKYITTLLILCNITTLVLFTCIYFFVSNSFFTLPKNLLLLMFLQFLVYPAQIFWMTKQRYEYKYKLVTLYTVVSVLISQITSLIFVVNLQGHNLAEVRLWSVGIITILFNLPIYVYLHKQGNWTYDKDICLKTLMLALPLIPHYLAQHVMTSADKIMLANMVGATSAGVYSIAVSMCMVITIIWNAINTSLVPFTFENLNMKIYHSINKIITILLLVYFVGCILVVLLAPELIRILAPIEYYAGLEAVPPLVGVAFLTAIYNLYANIEFYYKKTTIIPLATIFSCAMNILLNYFFIPMFGFIGAAYASYCTYVMLIVLNYYGYRKCNVKGVYNDKVIWGSCFGFVIIVVLSDFIYNILFLRWLLIVLIICILIIKYKYILNYINLIVRR